MSVKRAMIWMVAIVGLVAVVLVAGFEEVTNALLLFEPLWLVGLGVLQMLTIGLTAFGWHVGILATGGRIGFGETLRIHLAGSFVESVTPSSKLGGEATKIHFLRRHTGLKYRELVTVTLVTTVLAVLPFLVFSGVFFVWGALKAQVVLPAVLAFLTLGVFVGILLWVCYGKAPSGNPVLRINRGSWRLLRLVGLFVRKAFAFLRKAGRQSRHLFSRRKRLALLGLNSIIWILYPFKVFLVTQMLGMEVGFAGVATATYVAYLVSMVPLLPGGVGSFEATMALLLGSVGVPFAEGLAVALLARLITFWFPLLLSVLAVALTLLRSRSTHKRTGALGKKNVLSRLYAFILTRVNGALNSIERMSAKSGRLYRWYRDRFYGRLVERELSSVSLEPGARVLHIGCGHLPMTALYLAEMGLHVAAIDWDPSAVCSACKMIRTQSLHERVAVWEADGTRIDCSSFDAVWISLVVANKPKIVKRALDILKPGGCVLYRNFRGVFSLLYPRLDPAELGPDCEYRYVYHAFGKETIVVWRKLAATS